MGHEGGTGGARRVVRLFGSTILLFLSLSLSQAQQACSFSFFLSLVGVVVVRTSSLWLLFFFFFFFFNGAVWCGVFLSLFLPLRLPWVSVGRLPRSQFRERFRLYPSTSSQGKKLDRLFVLVIFIPCTHD
jgi:hypothetical protein